MGMAMGMGMAMAMAMAMAMVMAMGMAMGMAMAILPALIRMGPTAIANRTCKSVWTTAVIAISGVSRGATAS